MVAVPLPAQEPAGVQVLRQENVRATPNGVLLGVLDGGTQLAWVGGEGEWVEVVVEGWVWTRSMQIVDRAGFDLVITEPGGENLRTRPQGPRAGRFVEGTLLEEVERVPGWVRVRRRGWIWAASVEVTPGAAPEQTGAPAAAGRAGAAGARGASDAPGPGGGTDAPVAAAPPEPIRERALLADPDGDTLARVGPTARVEVLERAGGWARVRLDGWIWQPDSAAPEAGPADVGPGRVAREPERWRGRLVRWPLHFISLEEAEAVRTDFQEGEPFLLTRASEDRDAPLVYVAVPPDLLAAAEALAPLERITVTGRIRTGASALTGSPILDLVDLRRGGGR